MFRRNLIPSSVFQTHLRRKAQKRSTLNYVIGRHAANAVVVNVPQLCGCPVCFWDAWVKTGTRWFCLSLSHKANLISAINYTLYIIQYISLNIFF